MTGLVDNPALVVTLTSVTVAIVALSVVHARRAWRFDRLALRGFDLPFEPAGPFRQSEPRLRPMYGFVRDPGCQIFFLLHLLATIGGVTSLATTLWFAVAVVEGAGQVAAGMAAITAAFAAILAVPMWRGQRRGHIVISALMALFVFAIWPPGVTLLLVIVVVQHDLIRRRAIADQLELRRRQDHEQTRRAATASA